MFLQKIKQWFILKPPPIKPRWFETEREAQAREELFHDLEMAGKENDEERKKELQRRRINKFYEED